MVKVGSSSLTSRGRLDPARLDAIVDARRRAGQRRPAGGAGVLRRDRRRASARSGCEARPRDLATQQAAASVGQLLLAERYAASFARYGLRVGQVLLTADDLHRRGHYRNADRTLERLLALGVIPIVNENDTVATHEIRFGDNDRLAALVAHLVHADALVLLTDVDGLYTGKPGRPGSQFIARGRVDGRTRRGGRQPARAATSARAAWSTKIDAAAIATSEGIPVLLAAGRAGSSDALRGHGRHAVPRGRRPVGVAAVLAAPRHDARAAALRPRRRRGRGGRRAPDVAAAGRRHRGAAASSTPASRSNSSVRTAPWSPAAWSATTPPTCRRCSGRKTADLPAEFRREVVHRDDLVLPLSSAVARRRDHRSACLEEAEPPIDAGHVGIAGRQEDRPDTVGPRVGDQRRSDGGAVSAAPRGRQGARRRLCRSVPTGL